MPPPSNASVAEVKRLWDDAVSFYGHWHDAIGEELSFAVDQQHYDDDNSKDPQRIKPIDPALLNMQRHKAAKILKASEYYEMRGRDENEDPQAAADGKGILDHFITDPESEFEDALEDVVDGSLAARVWALEEGFDPEAGPHGELWFASLDPRKVTWTPGFKNPHSRRCPWLCIEKQMLPSEIERMKGQGWKNTTGVNTDSQALAQVQGANSSGPIRTDLTDASAPSETQYTTVLFFYERFVKDTKKIKSYRTLTPAEYHMWCQECGFKGMPQGQLDVVLPEVGDPCPMCLEQGMLNPTQRITTEAIEPEVLAYRKGKRLRIVAPHDNREFYNGPWEYDTRGWTVTLYSPYNHPINPIPNSDTYYYRSLTCVSDAMLRLGYEQMRKAHGIILAPQDKLYDAYGENFAFSEHRDVAYYDEDLLNPSAIQWFQPPGLNAAWSTYFQTLQGVFAANKGTGDFSITPDKSRDIAYSSLRLQQETGDVPVDRHIRRFQRFKSIVLTRAYEILRSVLTADLAVRVLGPEGLPAVRRIRASGLPGFDVIVTAEPTIAQEELDKAAALEQVAMKPPHIRHFMARAMNINPRLLAELNQMDPLWQAFQQFIQLQSGAAGGNAGGMQTAGTTAPSGNGNGSPQPTMIGATA